MFVFILFSIITFMFYLRSKFGNENEDVLTMTTYCLGISTAISGFLIIFKNGEWETDIYYLAFIPFFAYGIYYVHKKTKAKSLNIQANQQRYFNEAKPRDIVKFYSVRKDIKSNRVETLVNKESKKLIKNGVIIPQFFLNFKDFTLTSIQTIDDLNQNAVFKAVFEKIKGFIKDTEARVDFNKVLQANDYKAEFFLMELWETHTKAFNISLANLEILAKNNNEIEFIGALDLLNLNCVKAKGAVLFYKYMEHKDRIKDYVKQEHLEVNPKEEVFDEKYALENDSNKVQYKG